MDELDISILQLLAVNGRMHSTDIAKELKLAASTIHKRIKNLEAEGIIEKFTIIVDPSMVGLNLTAIIGINIDSNRRINVINKIKKIKDVLEIHELLEPYDLLIKVRTFDINSLKKNVIHPINQMEGVLKTSTMITIKRLKEDTCSILF